MSEHKPASSAAAPAEESEELVEITCDFCGQPARSVRRVALDGAYERLRTPHPEQYACAECSESKERRRLGLERA